MDWSNPLTESSAGLGDGLHVGGGEWGMKRGKSQDDSARVIVFPFHFAPLLSITISGKVRMGL